MVIFAKFAFLAHRYESAPSELTFSAFDSCSYIITVINFTYHTLTWTWNKINTNTSVFFDAFVMFQCVKLGSLRWSCCGSGTSHKLLAPLSLELCGLLCIVVLCSQLSGAPAVPALLIRLILIKHTNNYDPHTHFRRWTAALRQDNVGSAESSFRIQIPH